MPQTFGYVINYVNELLPNSLNSSTLVTLINRESRKLYPYLTNSTISSTGLTVSSSADYALPSTDIHFDMLESVHVGDTTASTDTVYIEYDYAPSTEDIEGYRYYNAMGNKIGLFPVPLDAGLPIVLKYREPPVVIDTTSDSTTYMNFDEDLTQVLLDNVCSKIAKSGRFPRVSLANNYAIDGLVNKKEMMLRDKKKQAKDPNKEKWEWRDWV